MTLTIALFIFGIGGPKVSCVPEQGAQRCTVKFSKAVAAGQSLEVTRSDGVKLIWNVPAGAKVFSFPEIPGATVKVKVVPKP